MTKRPAYPFRKRETERCGRCGERFKPSLGRMVEIGEEGFFICLDCLQHPGEGTPASKPLEGV